MRKLFGTDGIRGKANAYPITAEIALKVGKAVAIVLKSSKRDVPKFLIGKDTRLSGYMLEYGLTSGITSMGADVLLVGPMPTPAIAHLTKSFAADAGIMISASHNPASDNGIKLFDGNGVKLPDAVEEKIEGLVLGDEMKTEHISADRIGRAVRIDDAQGRYIEYAKGTINNMSLKGIKIVLDCANGAAYKVSPLIFSELGAELVVINNKPDGKNINVESGAMHPEVLRAAVLGHQADAGITLDGDADRIIMVDEKGNIIDGDDILAVCGIEMLKRGTLRKNTVVGTGYTNLALDHLFEKHGGKVVRAENGDRYVIEEMRKNGYNFGGEQTGHMIFHDYTTSGDGTIAGLQMLSIMKEKKKKLSEVASILKKYPQVIVNVQVREKVPFDKMRSVKEEIQKGESALGKEGRMLIRYSGTEKKARIMVEGKDEKLIGSIAKRIASRITEEVGAR